MIEERSGDLLQTRADAIVNTVNTVGIMGKGIALQFKQAFPENYDAYRRACDAGQVRLGEMFVFDTGTMISPRWIINFPTKGHWKSKSKISDIEVGLRDLRRVVAETGISSIAIPPLGCGNGGLKWSDVEPLIRRELSDLQDVVVALYPPSAGPKVDEMKVATSKPSMTRGRALVISLLDLYGAAGYRHSLLEVQKLTYFLQEAGENLRLGFVKYHYGPYSENLNHVLQRIEGHYTRGYGDRSKAAEIFVLPEALGEAEDFLAAHAGAQAKLQRVGDLIEGFETPYGLELLSTVHWIATREQPGERNPQLIIEAVRRWNARKASLMQIAHVEAALDQLIAHEWLPQPGEH